MVVLLSKGKQQQQQLYVDDCPCKVELKNGRQPKEVSRGNGATTTPTTTPTPTPTTTTNDKANPNANADDDQSPAATQAASVAMTLPFAG